MSGMPTRLRTALAAALIGAVAVLTGGCAKMTEQFNDAERSGATNETPADVVAFPDGFSNVAVKCHEGDRVYVAFHGDSPYAALAVVPGGCATTPAEQVTP